MNLVEIVDEYAGLIKMAASKAEIAQTAITSTVDAFHKHLQPGDIILMTPKKVIGRRSFLGRIKDEVFDMANAATQGTEHAHAAMYMGPGADGLGHVSELREGVEHLTPLHKAVANMDIHAVRPDAPEHVRHAAVARAHAMATDKVNPTTYDIPAGVDTFLKHYTGKHLLDHDRRIAKNKHTCSTWVQKAYEGFQLGEKNTHPGMILPGHMERSENTKSVARLVGTKRIPVTPPELMPKLVTAPNIAAGAVGAAGVLGAAAAVGGSAAIAGGMSGQQPVPPRPLQPMPTKIAATKAEIAKTALTTTIDEFHKHLKPGDIILMSPKGAHGLHSLKTRLTDAWFQPLSKAVQGTEHAHAAMYMGGGHVTELRGGEGVSHRIPLHQAVEGMNLHAVRVDVPEHERHAAVARMHALVTDKANPVTYDTPGGTDAFLGTLTGKHLLEHNARIGKNKHTCSSLVQAAYPGVQLGEKNMHPGMVLPGHMERSENTSSVARLVGGHRDPTTPDAEMPRLLSAAPIAAAAVGTAGVLGTAAALGGSAAVAGGMSDRQPVQRPMPPPAPTYPAVAPSKLGMLKQSLVDVGSIEEMKKHLKPGDIFLETGGAAPPGSSDAFRMFNSVLDAGSAAVQGGPYTHASGYVGDGKLVETGPGHSAQVKSLEEAFQGRNIRVVRPNVPGHERRAAAARMLELANAPNKRTYDMPGVIATAASRVFGTPLVDQKARQDEGKFICSGIVSHGYHKRDFSIPGSGGVLVPGDFMHSPHVSHVANLEQIKHRDFLPSRETSAQIASNIELARAAHPIAQAPVPGVQKIATEGIGAPPMGTHKYEEMSKGKWKQVLKDVPMAALGGAIGYGVGHTAVEYLIPKMLKASPALEGPLMRAIPAATAAAAGLTSYLMLRQHRLMKDRREQAAKEHLQWPTPRSERHA